ncbi:hypothetical protein [Streptomyces sp. NPDC055036]
MTAPTEPPALDDLDIGDKIVLKRVLDHPAYMKSVAADPRDGETRWVPDGSVQEVIGTTTVAERRHIPASPSPWRPSEEKDLVRLPNGFWYDLATGLQDSSGATRIEPA